VRYVHACTCLCEYIYIYLYIYSRSQWPCGLRRGSATARLLGLWVRIQSGVWISVSCECCVLSGRGLCDELVPRRREVLPSVVCLSVIVKPRTMRRPRPPRGCRAIGKKKKMHRYTYARLVISDSREGLGPWQCGSGTLFPCCPCEENLFLSKTEVFVTTSFIFRWPPFARCSVYNNPNKLYAQL
jgi:hypothetical protein